MRTTLLGISLLILCTALSAYPVWSEDIPVRETYDLRYNGCSLQDSDGFVYNIWAQTYNGYPSLLAQKFTTNGVAEWTEPLLIKAENKTKEQAQIVLASDGNIIVSWIEQVENGQCRIHLQKFSPTGQLLWNQAGVIAMQDLDSGGVSYVLVRNAIAGVTLIARPNSLPRLRGQSFDGNGLPLWSEDHFIIMSGNQLVISGALPAANGGFFLFYKAFSAISGTNYAEHYSAAGYRMWRRDYPRLEGEDISPHRLFKTPNGYLYDIAKSMGIDTRLVITVWDSNGELQVNPPLEIVVNNLADASMEYDAALQNSDQLTFLITRSSAANYTEVALFQHVSTHETSKSTQVILASLPNIASSPAIAIDNQNYVHCQWLEQDSTSGINTLKAQKTDADNQILWQAGGVSVASSLEIVHYPRMYAYGGSQLSLFHGADQERNYIKKQSLTTSGEAVYGNIGFSYATLLKGYTSHVANIAFNDRNLVFFTDNRENGQQRLYYQLLDQSGNLLIDNGGTGIGGYTPTIKYLGAVALPDNTVALAYNNPHPMLQFIDYNGNQILDNGGLQIYTTTLTSIMISAYQGDVYLGWIEASPSGNQNQRCLKGQRISAQQKMWGDTGKVLKDGIHYLNANINPSAGRFYVWNQLVSSMNSFVANVLLVDESGNPAASWSAEGITVISGISNASSTAVYAGLMNDDLAIVINGSAPIGLRAQRISSTGQLLWGNAGVEVLSQSALGLSCANNGESLALLYFILQGQTRSVRLQKLNLQGAMQFGASGIQLDNIPRVELRNPALGNCANGSYIAVWAAKTRDSSDEIDLFYRSVSSFGEAIGSGEQYLCRQSRAQDYPKLGMHGNFAIVSWLDARAGQNENLTNLSAIYAQKLSGEYSYTDPEPVIPALQTTLKPCYPNPFTSAVNVSWVQKTSAPIAISVYNLRGQRVKNLVAANHNPGEHQTSWQGDDEAGNKVAAGLYLIRMDSPGHTQTVKAVKW